MTKKKELVELPPSCTWCEEFTYKRDSECIYRCKVNCACENDIFLLFEDCPYMHLKYAVREYDEED